jgi:hypothetical protein
MLCQQMPLQSQGHSVVKSVVGGLTSRPLKTERVYRKECFYRGLRVLLELERRAIAALHREVPSA